jgi:hypothetical protein
VRPLVKLIGLGMVCMKELFFGLEKSLKFGPVELVHDF